MKIKTTKLVVRPHRPLRQFLFVVTALVLVGLAAWMTFEYGQWQQLYARMTAAARSSNPDLQTVSIEQLKADNERLRQRVAILERAAQIDKEAHTRLQAHVRTLQDETLELKEEIEFYRKVVAAAKKNTGLHIQGFRVNALGETGHYHYKLVLTNLDKDDKVTNGDALIEISGRANGSAQKLNLTTLSGGAGPAKLRFSFMHFHRLEGDFSLPDGFNAESVRVVIRDTKAKEPPEEKVYDWKPLVQAEG